MVKKLFTLVKDNHFKSFSGNIFFAGLGFVSIFILARSFSQHDFGLWMLYLSGFSLMEMIRSGLTNNALIRFLAAAKTENEKLDFIGACWISNSTLTVAIVGILYGISYLFSPQIIRSGFALFFLYYPLTSIVVLPFNNATTILHATQHFGRMNILRMWNSLSFIIFLVLNWSILHFSIYQVVWAHIVCNALPSIYAIIKGWSGIQYIFRYRKEKIKELLRFGKFSLGTLLGSNLLKSSDSLIIGIMMNPSAVAFYSIPLKLMEILEIPVKSIVAVALPKMSKANGEGDNDRVRNIFYQYTGLLTWLLIPVMFVMILLAKPLVILFGGEEYAGSAPIFIIFLLYTVFIPLDRFSGVTLDCINKPKLNFYKVLFMTLANITGDIIVIHIWGRLEGIAVVTIINILVGVYFGYYFLNREINIHLPTMLKNSWKEYRNFSNLLKRK